MRERIRQKNLKIVVYNTCCLQRDQKVYISNAEKQMGIKFLNMWSIIQQMQRGEELDATSYVFSTWGLYKCVGVIWQSFFFIPKFTFYWLHGSLRSFIFCCTTLPQALLLLLTEYYFSTGFALYLLLLTDIRLLNLMNVETIFYPDKTIKSYYELFI